MAPSTKVSVAERASSSGPARAQANQPDEHIDARELNHGALAYSLVALRACGHA